MYLQRLRAFRPGGGGGGSGNAGTIDSNVTYTIGPSAGKDFAEPGEFTDWISTRRIAPGVVVTADIEAGTYVMTVQPRGHIDGQRINYTGPAVNGKPFRAQTRYITAASGTGTVVSITFRGLYPYPIGQTVIIAGLDPVGYNGTYVVTSRTFLTTGDWSTVITYAGTTTGSLINTTPGTIVADFSTLDSVWTYNAANIDLASITANKTTAEAMCRAKFNVIFEFTGSFNTAFVCDNLHSGNWAGAPCLWINTGTTQDGVTTGTALSASIGDGPGGVASFNNNYFFGFLNAGLYCDYGGVVNLHYGGSLFNGQIGVRMDFGGVLYAEGVVLIGNFEYGGRGNHGGHCYCSYAYIRGCGSGWYSTNSTAMFYLHDSDIQYNFTGLTCDYGGSGKCFAANVKNNAFAQMVVGDGSIDARDVDARSTILARVPPVIPSWGCIISGLGDIILTGSFLKPIITGHSFDLRLQNCGMFRTEATGALATQYGTAYSLNTPITPDLAGNLLPPASSLAQYANCIAITGTVVVPVLTQVRSVGIIATAAVVGTPINVTTLDLTNVAAGDVIYFTAPNAATGETVTFTEAATTNLVLGVNAVVLANVRDTLPVVKTTSSNLALSLGHRYNLDHWLKNETNGYTLVEGESGKTLYNNSSSAATVVKLPGAAASLNYTFVVSTAQPMVVSAAAGDVIWWGVTATVAGGKITGNSRGQTLMLYSVDTTNWFTTFSMGTWVVT